MYVFISPYVAINVRILFRCRCAVFRRRIKVHLIVVNLLALTISLQKTTIGLQQNFYVNVHWKPPYCIAVYRQGAYIEREIYIYICNMYNRE